MYGEDVPVRGDGDGKAHVGACVAGSGFEEGRVFRSASRLCKAREETSGSSDSS